MWLGFGDAPTLGAARSSRWPETKRRFALISPKKCAVCGNTRVQLHHKQSFASKPELENDLNNLVWLCQGVLTKNHHLEVGHLGSFFSLNEHVDEWIVSYRTRPRWDGQKWVYKVTN